MHLRREAIASSDYWEYQPGDPVMTVDGFPGTVDAVEDGPTPGSENYIVTLDHGLGGGNYSSGMLAPMKKTVTSGVTGAGVHLAVEDYPELGTTIDDRPDPGKMIFTAAIAEEDDGPEPPTDGSAKDLPQGSDQPSSCSYCGGTEFKDQTDNGRVQQATCAVCGGTMSAHPGMQWTPELIGDPSNHPSAAVDPRSGASGAGGTSGINDSISFDSRGSVTTASLEVPARKFNFAHDSQDTGGTKFPTKHTLHATDAESSRSGGSAEYFPPKRKGGPVHVDRLSTNTDIPGAGSALMDEIENRHPGSPVKFIGETGRDKNMPSHTNGAHGKPTDWDTWHPGVEEDGIHRGFAAKLAPEHAGVINNPRSSKEDHLSALHKAIPEGPNLGMHWTANNQQAKNFAHSGVMDPRTTIPVVLHAQGPSRKDIETRPDQLFRNGVFPFDHGVEKEVPMRRGRQVKVTGISWKPDAEHPDADRDGWMHHTYPEGGEKQHTAAHAFSWEDIGDRHPHIYGDSDIHGKDADGADGPGIGEAANYLAHERPGHLNAEDTSVNSLDFHETMVHPRHIDYNPNGSDDLRVQQARKGYQKNPHQMPPLVLVHRHGVYQVADGHHRAEAAAGLSQSVRAYVAHSPYPDEPFSDGKKGPFHGAERVPKQVAHEDDLRAHMTVEHGYEKMPRRDDKELAQFHDQKHFDCPADFHSKMGSLAGHDWCTWRRESRCTFPGDSTAVSLAIPQDRGPCPWETPWQQQVCPISEPGPMALMQAKGSLAAAPCESCGGKGYTQESELKSGAVDGDDPSSYHLVKHDCDDCDGKGHTPEVSDEELASRNRAHQQRKVDRVAEHLRNAHSGDQASPTYDNVRACPPWCPVSDEFGRLRRARGFITLPLRVVSSVQTAALEARMAANDDDDKQLPPDAGALLRTAARDAEFGFHVTASWRDVQAKAKRIRAEGGVTIVIASADGIGGQVKGDHGTYEAILVYRPGTRKVSDYACGCKWAAYAWDRSPAFKRFEGRQCSHALALQYEAQSQGMFGKEVHSAEPAKRVPTITAFDPDTGQNILARPYEGSLAHALVARLRAEDADPAEVVGGLMRAGMRHAAALTLFKEAEHEQEGHHCPHCGAFIGIEAVEHHHCPHCGAPLGGEGHEHHHGSARNPSGPPFAINLATTDQAAPAPSVDGGRFGRVGVPFGASNLPGVRGGRGLSGQNVRAEGAYAEVVQPDTQSMQASFPAGAMGIPVMAAVVDDELGWDLPSGYQPHEAMGIEVLPLVNDAAVAVPSTGADPHVAAIILGKNDLPDGAGGEEFSQPSVAGMCLKAHDTGRILMLQRGLEDEDDPARGTWEMPGGHIEPQDLTSLHGAIREWTEEVGQPFPDGGTVKHTWTSPNGVYQGHVVVIPTERDLKMHDGRVTVNPDDPKGDHHEQAAWWEIEHAKKNPALRPEMKNGTPWKEIEKASLDAPKTAAAWDSISNTNPQPGRGTTQPAHSNTTNPGSTGWAASDDPDNWSNLDANPQALTPSLGFDGALHDAPEPALPVAYGDSEDKATGWIPPGTRPAEFSQEDLDPVPDNPSQPAYLVPNQDSDVSLLDGGTVTPETGRTASIIADFQKSAAGQALLVESQGEDDEIAIAAQAHLARTAAKQFNFAEQQELINEGNDGRQARNLGSLKIGGTHYELLDEAFSREAADSLDLFI